MKRIQQLPFGATGCAVIPGRQGDPNGFIKTDSTHPLTNKPIYVSAEAVRIMGAEFGLISRDEREDDQARIIELEGRVEELEEELSSSEAVFQAIDVLESQGYNARRKPGRKPLPKAAA